MKPGKVVGVGPCMASWVTGKDVGFILRAMGSHGGCGSRRSMESDCKN